MEKILPRAVLSFERRISLNLIVHSPAVRNLFMELYMNLSMEDIGLAIALIPVLKESPGLPLSNIRKLKASLKVHKQLWAYLTKSKRSIHLNDDEREMFFAVRHAVTQQFLQDVFSTAFYNAEEVIYIAQSLLEFDDAMRQQEKKSAMENGQPFTMTGHKKRAIVRRFEEDGLWYYIRQLPIRFNNITPGLT